MSAQSPRIGAKEVIGFLINALLLPPILFLVSGRPDWWEAWVMAGLFVAVLFESRLLMVARDPALARERASSRNKPGILPGDKALLLIVAVIGPFAQLVVAGLDKRWGASPGLPPWLELAAFAVVALGYAISAWAMASNRFFSAVVRIQADRGHTVIDRGPYRYVRHPGYAGALLTYLAIPLALGTLWAFLPAFVIIAALVIRTDREDRFLQRELPGYPAYVGRTRHRLLPGVW
jgi:protein-S-isoprenylcysteine O-methyltransferase Ste14